LAVGVALLIPAIGAVWRGASFRSDSLNRWQARIDVAISGLNENAVTELRRINGLTARFLVGLEGGNFDPLQVVADPSQLSVPVRTFLNLLHVCGLLRRRFTRFLRLGGLLVGGGLAYILGDAGVDAHFAKLYDVGNLYLASWALGGAGVLSLLVALVGYIYYNRRLSSAQLMSQ